MNECAFTNDIVNYEYHLYSQPVFCLSNWAYFLSFTSVSRNTIIINVALAVGKITMFMRDEQP